MKTDLFQSYGHCSVFQICWHIECSTFIASSFRIWNSSTGIPSPPLALIIVMLLKAHLTSHSRMSGSRWVITPLLLSGSWRSFFHSSSVYSCHLFLISSASVRSVSFLFFIEPIFAWNVPLVSLIFLKRALWASLVAQMVKHLPAMQETWVRSLGWEDPLEKEMATHSSILAWKIPWSSLSQSIVFLYFFALITAEGFLISSCYSLKLCIQMDISFLFSFAFCFYSFHSYL